MADTLVVPIKEFLATKFDFLILGGGTAGLTIASRLTENPNVTVGVLEIGKNRTGDPRVDVPAAHLSLLNDEEYDFKYRTEPQVSRESHESQQWFLKLYRSEIKTLDIISHAANC
jgi:choline dehydrogenase-like flavoprotein